MRFFNPIFLTVSGISVFGSSLTNLCLLTIAAKEADSFGITLVTGLAYLAIIFTGFLTSYLTNLVGNKVTLRASEFTRFALLLFIFFIDVRNIYVLAGLSFILNVVEGIFGPNRFYFLNNYFDKQEEKNLFFTKLQSIDNTLVIVGPMIAGLLIMFISIKLCFLIDSISYLISFIFWLKINYQEKSQQHREKVSLTAGYKTIIKNKSLLIMNIARLLGNYIFAYWKIILPIIILSIFTKNDFSKIQGYCLSAMAFGLFITNIILPKLVRKEIKDQENAFLLASLIPVIFSGLILFLFNLEKFYILILISFLFGIANAGFRTAGIMIGTRVTPSNVLHLVISAADSLIRPLTALVVFAIGYFVRDGITSLRLNILTSILIVVSILSFVFYRLSQQKFKQ